MEIDNQTVSDLGLLDSIQDSQTIIGLFTPATIGGRSVLRKIFTAPLTDIEEIIKRKDAINYLQQTGLHFKYDKENLDFIEYYLKQPTKPTNSRLKAIQNRIKYFFKPSHEYYLISRGITLLLEFLNHFKIIQKKISSLDSPVLLQEFSAEIHMILNSQGFLITNFQTLKNNLSAIEIQKLDYLFRYTGNEKIRSLLDIAYFLDVFSSVAHTSKELGFAYPEVLSDSSPTLIIKDFFHPSVTNPVKNDIHFDEQQNVYFLTGANMAGKSTFLKSIGISVFLSQIGFPVPASFMRTSLFHGLITTINISDNISSGYSHFYSEVLRIKSIALKINNKVRLLVVFDELFRGTNVKDAYDASLAVIKAFSKVKGCFFLISTHIFEIAEELKHYENIKFGFMQTRFENDTPVYSYKLQNGVTDERLGMWILNNEKIVEIIENNLT